MQVFDLKDVKPHEFVQYGLKCLEMLAGIGDSCVQRHSLKVKSCGMLRVLREFEKTK